LSHLPPIPPSRQRQIELARQRRMYEQRQRRIRQRRRQLMLMRLAFFGSIALVCVVAVLLVIRFIDHNSKPTINEDNPINDIDQEIVEQIPEPEINEEHGSKLNLSELIDPATLNPNDKIDLDYKIDQILPKVYYTSDTPYTTFATDNPDLGSNVDTKVIVIDAGHQEGTRTSDVWLSPYIDPAKNSSWVHNSLLTIGATGVSTKIPEYKTTHEIAEKMKAELEDLGYTVYLSHPDIKEKLSGSQRASVANRNNADLMISLHCNSYDDDKSQSGALALVPKIWEGYPSERLSYLSKKAATVLLEEYNKATGLKNRGIDPITKSSMFSFCKVPIVLFELGFSTCPSDDKNMNDPVFQDKIVDGMIAGINKYFSLIELANADDIIIDTGSTVVE